MQWWPPQKLPFAVATHRVGHDSQNAIRGFPLPQILTSIATGIENSTILEASERSTSYFEVYLSALGFRYQAAGVKNQNRKSHNFCGLTSLPIAPEARSNIPNDDKPVKNQKSDKKLNCAQFKNIADTSTNTD